MILDQDPSTRGALERIARDPQLQPRRGDAAGDGGDHMRFGTSRESSWGGRSMSCWAGRGGRACAAMRPIRWGGILGRPGLRRGTPRLRLPAVKFGWHPLGPDPVQDEAIVRRLREAIGPAADLLIDGGLAWDAETAIERQHSLRALPAVLVGGAAARPMTLPAMPGSRPSRRRSRRASWPRAPSSSAASSTSVAPTSSRSTPRVGLRQT